MVVGIPSPTAIAEEGDMHICELPNSIPDSTVLSVNKTDLIPEYPFEFLSGEKLIDQGMDLTDGYIYLTNYRLFMYSNQSTSTHYSFINYPLRLIESIEIKDNIYLYFQCKDFRSFRLIFFTSEKCCYWLKKFNENISIINTLEDLFAIKYSQINSKEEISNQPDYFHQEITRLKLDISPWRITEINRDYKLSPSYPNICVVPERMTDEEVHGVAKFRSYRRFPTIVWR